MSTHKTPAFFISGSLGLDFLNTLATPVDVQVDWIDSGEGLLSWLEQAGFATAEELEALRGRSISGEIDSVAALARGLREWFRDFIRERSGRKLTAGDLAELEPLNRLLDRDEWYHQVALGPDSAELPLELKSRRRLRTPEALLLPIAEEIARFVCSGDFQYAKACEGLTCTLLFVDRTRGRVRRWCSMAICGNRAKQAAHRDRRKLEP